MRLIDADKLIARFKELKGSDTLANMFVSDVIKEIKKMPTAYDIDKVVDQLEEERELSYADFDRYVEELSPCLDAEYNDFFHRGIERAIRIVKGGGVDAGSI